MSTPLQEALKRIEALVAQADTYSQAYTLWKLQAIAEELERDRAWDELLASPESQAYLKERGEEVLREFEAGETEEGGFAPDDED